MTSESVPTRPEIEVKVRIADRAALESKLPSLGFKLVTPETLERNILFDTQDGELRRRGQLLRIRKYGDRWILTHKAPSENGSKSAHKIRLETETEISNGEAMATVLERLGYRRIFVYEKLRTEWFDGQGHLVMDVTPIGTFGELEGQADWIDKTASSLEISQTDYLTLSYGQLFQQWKSQTGSLVNNMTFDEAG